tara:strand:+ start:8467 stop:8772 length:306 start_codon:yes stop_codon:yes gene_type:complete
MKYSSKKASGYYEYREKNRTKLRDLIYFLGEDWIDISAIGNEKNTQIWRDTGTSAYQPKKCDICKKYWHIALNRRKKKSEEYLLDSIFGNMPVIIETCSKC